MNERRKHSDLSSVSGSEDSEVIRTTRLSQNKLKTNRLSRSLRQTQQSPSFDSSYNCHKEFKTPKRHARIRPCASHNADSPSNDSDLQQDIIWDPTSPTAVWNGKGVKKSSTNVRAVDISELANRIAPKNERPVVPESSLLQWIGDSAVPCTPEVQLPRTRKKSTRHSDVEDLMKLAKQFDFNMHQQDKEQVKEAYKGSVKQDADNLREPGGPESSPPPSLSEVTATSRGPASKMLNCGKPQTTDRKALHQETVDDFDALFDQPTQHISGRLSQASSGRSLDGRASSVPLSSNAALSGNGNPGNPGNPSAVSSAPVKKPEGGPRTPAPNRFVDDDWDDDDLLNDSIVLEMTQNPELFATPKHCSTQIGPSPKQRDFVQKPGAGSGVPGPLPNCNGAKGFDGPHQGKNPKSKSRSTFQLETNPNFLVNETLSGEEPSSCHGVESGKPGQPGGLQSRPNGAFQPHRAAPLEPSNRNNLKSQAVPGGGREKSTQVPVVQPSSSTTSGSGVARPGQVGDRVSSAHGVEGAESERDRGGSPAENTEPVEGGSADAMHEDLDSIFASDSLWDDGDDYDDDLLCQVCEDVEKLSESQAAGPAAAAATACPDRPYAASNGPKVAAPSTAGNGAAAQSGYAGTRGPAAGFSRSVSVPGSTAAAFTETTLSVKPGSLAGKNDAVSAANRARQISASFPQGDSASRTGSYKFAQPQKATTMTMSATDAAGSGATAAPRYAGAASSAKNPGGPPHPSFKRHLSDPVALTNKVFVPNQVTVKCTLAEIERKKQEALARRRLRMQMSQKQGGPT
ncbi:ewing's tumor-associated antigen 1 [Anguilla anguilla]|uniref:ewing's tumor-associated antigen 1 n=1 Tax=Anguilla anguilla TaxID=7936 RepID=UPI0015AF104C|nr:ewing's tumor-associated antigen 1 [Anguilla anguilla]